MELTYLLIKTSNHGYARIKSVGCNMFQNWQVPYILFLFTYPALVCRICHVSQSVIRKIINLIFFSQYVKDHVEIFTSKFVSFSNLLQRYNKFLNYKNFGAKNFIFFIFCFSGGPRFEQDRKVMSLTCYQLHKSAIFVIRVRLELTTYRLVYYSRFYTSQLRELL